MKLGLMTRRTGLVPPFKGFDAQAQDLIARSLFRERMPVSMRAVAASIRLAGFDGYSEKRKKRFSVQVLRWGRVFAVSSHLETRRADPNLTMPAADDGKPATSPSIAQNEIDNLGFRHFAGLERQPAGTELKEIEADLVCAGQLFGKQADAPAIA